MLDVSLPAAAFLARVLLRSIIIGAYKVLLIFNRMVLTVHFHYIGIKIYCHVVSHKPASFLHRAPLL